MRIKFYKYQGTGNDFIILDNRRNEYDDLTSKQVKFICNRRFGIGADGLMLLNTLDGYDFEMKYYNSNGKESTMCGNGGRCLVQFAYDMGMHKLDYKFLAVDGVHGAEFDNNGWVELKMKDVDKINEHLGNYQLNTGSPHYVKFVNDIHNYEVFNEGKRIRYSKDFKDQGINVNFVELEEDGIYVRTYERGVEDETLSCGTGVTASALAAAHNEFGFNRVEVQTLGGRLAVEFDKTGDEKFENIWLCGPATFVYKGEIELR
jgi:diaminopimelate epimerase